MRITALGMVVVMLMAALAGCDGFFKSDEEKIAARLEEFIDCCNSGDLDGALDCLDKTSRKTYGAVVDVGSAIFGGLVGIEIDVRDLMALVMGFTPQEFLELEINSITIDSDETATAVVTMAFNDPQTGEKHSQENITLPMVKENWDWYIDARIDWNAVLQEMY